MHYKLIRKLYRNGLSRKEIEIGLSSVFNNYNPVDVDKALSSKRYITGRYVDTYSREHLLLNKLYNRNVISEGIYNEYINNMAKNYTLGYAGNLKDFNGMKDEFYDHINKIPLYFYNVEQE